MIGVIAGVARADGATRPRPPVAKLAQAVNLENQCLAPLKSFEGRLFKARWIFDDAKDSGDVDLCDDPHIVVA